MYISPFQQKEIIHWFQEFILTGTEDWYYPISFQKPKNVSFKEEAYENTWN